MNLLIVTEKIDTNNELLAYLHGHILDAAKRCDHILVLCLEAREYQFPENVQVFSLGKEQGRSRLGYLCNFYRIIVGKHSFYDSVFIYRSPLFVLLGAWYWRLSRKKVTLWYNHQFIDWQLRLATFLATKIISPAKSGFPLLTAKLQITDQWL